MMNLGLPGRSFFSSPSPPAVVAPPPPPPPPPPPTREDPAVAEARKKLRTSELRRRGRAATILTSGQGVLGEADVARPAADKLG